MLVLSRIGASSLQVLVDRVLICYAWFQFRVHRFSPCAGRFATL